MLCETEDERPCKRSVPDTWLESRLNQYEYANHDILAMEVEDDYNPARLLTVTLERKNQKFGLVLAEFYGDNDRIIVVEEIRRNSPSELSGNIYIGDELLEIDGEPISTMFFEEIVGIIRSLKTVTLTLQRTEC